jgi:hypothetical protein
VFLLMHLVINGWFEIYMDFGLVYRRVRLLWLSGL